MPVYIQVFRCACMACQCCHCDSESEFWEDLRSGECLKSMSSSSDIIWRSTAMMSSPVTLASAIQYVYRLSSERLCKAQA